MLISRFRFLMASLAMVVMGSLASVVNAGDASIEFAPATGAGSSGLGAGKHIVFVSGDEEYRSEEACPALAKILSQRHGFKCTVLFAVDPKTGEIDPNASNIPDTAAVNTADLVVFHLRFRNLPDEQMKPLADYIESGKPMVGLRTSTHAFNIPGGKTYSKYTWTNGDKAYEKGFGKQVLGETWVSHWGNHGSQSTRGIIAEGKKDHPILRGIADGDIWGPSDVYEAKPIGDSDTLVLGQIVAGMKPTDPPADTPRNKPMMPVAWTKSYKGDSGKTSRVFTSTMGAATDLEAEGTRRLVVNGCLWALGLEEKIPAKTDVALVGEYQPTKFGFNAFKKGTKPTDYLIK
ncbi:MAG: ThuA domain-containing protein [Pirellulales bacterium]